MKLLKILSIAYVIVFGLYSCSSDEDGNEVSIQINPKDVKLDITSITEKGVTLSYTGSFDNPNGYTVYYGIKKKGESTFKRYPLEKNKVITDLNPVTTYIIDMVYDDRNGKENTIGAIEQDFFTTSLFQLIRETNSFMDINEHYIYSHEGFSHILKKSDKNTDSSEIHLVNVDNPNDSIPVIDLSIFEDRIEFRLPEDILSDTPYEYFKDYYIGIKSGNSYHNPINAFDLSNKDNSRPIKLRVFNKAVHIEKISIDEVRSGSGECREDVHFISFRGNFFTSSISGSQLNSYQPGLTEISDAVITRLSDGKEYIVQDQLTTTNNHCLAYDRISNRDFEGNLLEFPSLHYARLATIHMPIEESGDYKIKFTFNWEGEHYETNEFPFTLE